MKESMDGTCVMVRVYLKCKKEREGQIKCRVCVYFSEKRKECIKILTEEERKKLDIYNCQYFQHIRSAL